MMIALFVVAFSVFCSCVLAQDETSSIQSNIDLSAIKDDDWLKAEDAEAYYGLLNQAKSKSQTELRKAGREFVAKRKSESQLPTFVDMIRNPQSFRGQPVALSGHVLQTLEYEAEENEYDIETLYEVALFTDDSQGHPTTVIFLERPAELPIGGKLIDGVTASGYFLKTYWYDSSDNRTRKAPLVLAKTVNVRSAKASSREDSSGTIIFAAILVGVVVLIAVVASLQRADRKRLLAEQKKRLDLESPQFPVGE